MASSIRMSARSANILTLTCCTTGCIAKQFLSLISWTLFSGDQAGVTTLAALQKELRLLDELVGGLLAEDVSGRDRLVRLKEVLRNGAAAEWIEEKLGIEEMRAELAHDGVRIVANRHAQMPEQSARASQHRVERTVHGLAVIAFVEEQLRLEDLSLARDQGELSRRDDLSRALPNAHIANRVLAGIAPVGVEGGGCVVAGNGYQILEQRFQLGFSDALDKLLERFVVLAVCQEAIGDTIHHHRDILGGYGPDRQPVGAGVLSPLSAENHL